MPAADFWRPKWQIQKTDKIATAGSCFAQHIGKRLRGAAFEVLDYEPPPKDLPASLHGKHGYSLYSARHGNIYTVRQFLQLAQEAFGEAPANSEVWEHGGRFVDALRPTLDPEGHGTVEAVHLHRERHLGAVKRLFQTADIYVFTLGLTESWERVSDGRVYPVCPGTVVGRFDDTQHRFRNQTFFDAYEDFLKLRDLAARHRWDNNQLRFMLTVSPVPLTATAAGCHVMQATVYSKSVLRAVAGQLATKFDDVDYFPAYEIITNPWGSYPAYTSNLRSVAEEGVDLVMETFLRAQGVDAGRRKADLAAESVTFATAPEADNDEAASTVVCEDALLEAFGPRSA